MYVFTTLLFSFSCHFHVIFHFFISFHVICFSNVTVFNFYFLCLFLDAQFESQGEVVERTHERPRGGVRHGAGGVDEGARTDLRFPPGEVAQQDGPPRFTAAFAAPSRCEQRQRRRC